MWGEGERDHRPGERDHRRGERDHRCGDRIHQSGEKDHRCGASVNRYGRGPTDGARGFIDVRTELGELKLEFAEAVEWSDVDGWLCRLEVLVRHMYGVSLVLHSDVPPSVTGTSHHHRLALHQHDVPATVLCK